MQLQVSHGNLPVFMKQWVINENISRRKRDRDENSNKKKKKETILRPCCRVAGQLYTLEVITEIIAIVSTLCVV